MNLKRNVEDLKNDIAQCCTSLESGRTVKIVAATKYVDSEKIKDLYYNGIKDVGENRVNVFLDKYNDLKDFDLNWHFIGSLQSKKVKRMINKIDYLHSLDRLSLAKAIEKHATKQINCFVQVNTSGEDSKHGLTYTNAIEFIKELKEFSKIRVVGLMTMAPLTEDDETIKHTFSQLKKLQKEVKELELDYAPCTELSMGMSNDYKIALKEGATFIRIGSKLFK